MAGPVGWSLRAVAALVATGTVATGAVGRAGQAPPCVAGIPAKAWCGDGGPAAQARFASPGPVVVMSDGSVVMGDFQNGVLRRIAPDGTIATIPARGPLAGGGSGAINTTGFAARPDGDLLVGGLAFAPGSRTGTPAVLRVDSDGVRSVAWRPPGPPGAYSWMQIAGLPDGGFYAALSGGDVYRVDPDGASTRVLRTGFTVAPLAVTGDGDLLVVNSARSVVLRADPGGRLTRVVGIPGRGGFLADDGLRRVGDGGPATRARLYTPTAIAPTRDGGVLIADASNQRVRKVSPDGSIATIAGTGRGGFSGDGGPAIRARLSTPCGVAETPDGGVLVADTGNGRLRRIDRRGVITTIAGAGRPLGGGLCGALGEGGGGGLGDVDYDGAGDLLYLLGPARARAGRPISVRIFTTRPASVTVRLVGRGTRRLRRADLRPGAATASLGRGVRPGFYDIVVSLRGGGRRDEDQATLEVR
jgi:hypothetical protein